MSTFVTRPTRRTRAKHGGGPIESIEGRLLAAIERCLERGEKFGNLTIEQVTSEAGMSRGTFYDHFKDMGELVTRLMKVVTEEIIRDAGAWLALAAQPQRKDFEAAIQGMSATFRRHRAIIAAFHVTALFDPVAESHYDAMVELVCARSRQAVTAARSAGLVRPQADDSIADAVSWIIVMYFTRFALAKDDSDFDKFSRALTHICTTAFFLDEPQSTRS